MIALLLLVSGFAWAQPPEAPCAAETRAWAEALELVVVACPEVEQLVVRLEGAEPLDVEIARGDGPALFRVDGVRIAPVANVPDWGEAPAAWQARLEAIRAGLAARPPPSPLGAERVEAVREAPQRSWPWRLAALLLLLLPLGGRRRPGLGLLFAIGAVLRLALGPWSVFHTNGLGPFWLRGAILDPASLADYGAGYPELFSLPVRLLPSEPDLAVFGLNALLGAALAPCVFALARELGAGARAAWLVGLLVALDPVAIRFGATESYAPALALGLGLACLLGVRALRERGLRAGILGLACALVAAQTARVHPVVWPALLLVPLVAGGLGRRAAALALAIGAAVLLPLPSEFFDVLQAVSARGGEGGLLEPRVLGGPGSGAWLLALVIAAWALWVEPRGRRVAPALIAAVLLVEATDSVYGQSAVWQASYRRIFTAPLLASAALLLPMRLPRWAPALALLALLPGGASISDRTTEQLEYRWLRPRLQAADPALQVLVPDFVGPRQVLVADYLLPRPGRLRKVRDSAQVAELRAAGPALGIWTSVCSGPDSAARCAPFEGFVVVDEVSLPASPSFDELPYARDPVVVRWLQAP